MKFIPVTTVGVKTLQTSYKLKKYSTIMMLLSVHDIKLTHGIIPIDYCIYHNSSLKVLIEINCDLFYSNTQHGHIKRIGDCDCEMLTCKKNIYTTAPSQTSEIIEEKEIERVKEPQLMEDDHIYSSKETNFTDYMSEFSCVLVVCKLYTYAHIIPLCL